MSHSLEKLTISIAISRADRQTAQEFAREQPTSTKENQVYINTLAVLAVHHYLQMLEVPTNLQASHSWNPLGRLGADVADLYISGKGHLECRPVHQGEQSCYFPLDVWSNRIGYIIVEFDETYKEAKILGFLPQISNTIVPIAQLQSLDSLLTVLHSAQAMVRLSDWLNDSFTAAWQNLEDILLNQNHQPILNFSNARNLHRAENKETNSQQIQTFINQLYTNQALSRQPVEIGTIDPEPKTALINLLQSTQDEEIRWKAVDLLREIDPHNPGCGVRRAIDLGMQFGENAVALVVSILPKLDGKMAVLVQARPLNGQPHLPQGLQLKGFDSSNGEKFLDVIARRHDNHIQFKFTADIGDRFDLNITLGDGSITENFIV